MNGRRTGVAADTPPLNWKTITVVIPVLSAVITLAAWFVKNENEKAINATIGKVYQSFPSKSELDRRREQIDMQFGNIVKMIADDRAEHAEQKAVIRDHDRWITRLNTIEEMRRLKQ